MAIATAAVWEVRQQATSANANGGFFVTGASGTDYSQQGTAAYNLTGLTTVGAGSIAATAAASADMVGNGFHLVSGGSASTGWYQIVSVVAGTSITFDRNISTGVSSNIAGNVGGALSLQDASDQTVCNAMSAGNKVWILGGSHPTYTLTGTLNINSAAGTTLSQISFEGYAVTRGDKPAGSTRPNLSSKAFLSNINMNFTSMIFSSAVAAAQFTGSNRNWCHLCSFINTSTTANVSCVLPGNYCAFTNCEFVCTNGYGLAYGNEIMVANCYFHDSAQGIRNTNASGNYGSDYINNIFDTCTTAGIFYSGANDMADFIYGNTFFGGIGTPTGIGIDMSVTGAANKVIMNNIFTGLATGIVSQDASQALQGTSMKINWNNFYNNTTDVTNVTKGPQDLALNPSFANVTQLTGSAGTVSSANMTVSSVTGIVANQDYCYIVSGTGATAGQYPITALPGGNVITLASAPGGSGTNIVYQIVTGHNFAPGANMANGGSLGAFPEGLTTGYQDIGAAQVRYTDPGIAQVKSGTTYVFANANETGSYSAAGTGSTGSGFLGIKRVGH